MTHRNANILALAFVISSCGPIVPLEREPSPTPPLPLPLVSAALAACAEATQELRLAPAAIAPCADDLQAYMHGVSGQKWPGPTESPRNPGMSYGFQAALGAVQNWQLNGHLGNVRPDVARDALMNAMRNQRLRLPKSMVK